MLKHFSQNGKTVTIEVEFDLSGSMLEMEDVIQNACNEVGSKATELALNRFDSDGSPIIVAGVKLTVNKKCNRDYETPYGTIEIERNLYQTAQGGKTYCPLEEKARIIHNCTPRFAKMLSNKNARLNAREVLSDIEDNHNRKIALSFLQNVVDSVGSIAQLKEEIWEYHIPPLENEIKTIGISLDGTCVRMVDDGFREAMVGSISLYGNKINPDQSDSEKDQRKHTIYMGASPEYGKAKFLKRLTHEIEHVKKLYPNAIYVGVADGAKTNWAFLEKHVDKKILDFYHMKEYLSAITPIFGKDKKEQLKWLSDQCHQLKHDKGAAASVLTAMQNVDKTKHKKELLASLDKAITYFSNNINRMNYYEHTAQNLPIGSGVTEAACKSLVKHRCCGSGMKWKERGLKTILSLRAMVLTKSTWGQFWDKIDQYGVPMAA